MTNLATVCAKKRLHNFHDIRECQANGGCTDYTCRYYLLQGIGPSAYQKNMWLGTMLVKMQALWLITNLYASRTSRNSRTS